MHRSSETVFDVDENQIRTVVEKQLREAFRPKPKSESWDSPAWRSYRERQRIFEVNERHWKRGLAKAKRNQEAWAEEGNQRGKALELCPVVPPPQAY